MRFRQGWRQRASRAAGGMETRGWEGGLPPSADTVMASGSMLPTRPRYASESSVSPCVPRTRNHPVSRLQPPSILVCSYSKLERCHQQIDSMSEAGAPDRGIDQMVERVG